LQNLVQVHAANNALPLGDVVIWDNTGILHRALPYDPCSERTLHRTTIAGDEAWSLTQGITLDQNTYDKGREIRAAVLGEAYVNAASANADDFNKPFQDLVTEYRWVRCGDAANCPSRLAACSTWP
jgi:Taurine catabolism dioxygenase TauD, TfdA family